MSSVGRAASGAWMRSRDRARSNGPFDGLVPIHEAWGIVGPGGGGIRVDGGPAGAPRGVIGRRGVAAQAPRRRWARSPPSGSSRRCRPRPEVPRLCRSCRRGRPGPADKVYRSNEPGLTTSRASRKQKLCHAAGADATAIIRAWSWLSVIVERTGPSTRREPCRRGSPGPPRGRAIGAARGGASRRAQGRHGPSPSVWHGDRVRAATAERASASRQWWSACV